MLRTFYFTTEVASFRTKCSFNPTKANFFSSDKKISNIILSRKKISCGSRLMSVLNSKEEDIYINNNNNVRHVPHPLESQLHLLENYNDDHCDDEGIGILDFFQGKNILVTGATGLVGKTFVEKLLRATSVGKIYLLIKAEGNEAAVDRLTKEIIDSDLFKCLRDKHGSDYQTFVKEKLIAVAGNICDPNLGMGDESIRQIMEDVDVIVDSAASTILNGRYDTLLDINVNAPLRLLRFAKTCKNLKLFVHLSTAYVCGRKEGLIHEKPLIMGQNGLNIEDDSVASLSPRLDLADEISLAMKSCKASQDYDVTKHFIQLGQERTNTFGYYNTYHLTKALSEMVIDEIRGDTPVLIVRPTCIESTYKDPFPGWIQGIKCFDPVITSYGKGDLPAYLADPQQPMDVIPLDLVVKTMVASIAKHGRSGRSKPQLSVYHVASGVVNPLRFDDFFEILREYFRSKDIQRIKFFDNYGDFSKHTREAMSRDEKLRNKRSKARVAYAEQLCRMYEFIGFIGGRIHTGNTEKLLEEMSDEEKLNFGIDATKIDWRKYFMEIHIPGLEKHALKRTTSCV